MARRIITDKLPKKRRKYRKGAKHTFETEEYSDDFSESEGGTRNYKKKSRRLMGHRGGIGE